MRWVSDTCLGSSLADGIARCRVRGGQPRTAMCAIERPDCKSFSLPFPNLQSCLPFSSLGRWRLQNMFQHCAHPCSPGSRPIVLQSHTSDAATRHQPATYKLGRDQHPSWVAKTATVAWLKCGRVSAGRTSRKTSSGAVVRGPCGRLWWQPNFFRPSNRWRRDLGGHREEGDRGGMAARTC